MPSSKISSYKSTLFVLLSTAAFSFNATAETSPNCSVDISEGNFTANIKIAEYYPGSELHRQIVQISGTPETVPPEVKSIKTPVGPVNAVLSLEQKTSLKDKDVLKKGDWGELQMTMELPRLAPDLWYHKNCTIETSDYILADKRQIEGGVVNHCNLMLQDAQMRVLESQDYLDYAFSGNDHWQPLRLRYDLKQLKTFNSKISELSAKQIDDFKTGKCTF